MLQLRNHSPFVPTMAMFPDRQGIDTLYVPIQATFALGPVLTVADKQVAPPLADAYYGEPESSSLRTAGEMHLGKPGTDVVLRGSARAPRGRAIPSMRVSLRVAERIKSVQVTGDRTYLGARGISQPEPFTSMPLIYERAFGGTLLDPDGRSPPRIERRNPVGVGLALAHRRGKAGDPLPNLEDPADLLRGPGQHPAPQGFGFVTASWEPRVLYGGTYDARWQRERAPYLPVDFDPRHFQSAAPELTFARHLEGGEPVRLEGVSADGTLAFALPRCALRVDFRVRGQHHTPPVTLETVLVDTDEGSLQLTFRAALACDRCVLQVEQIEVFLDALQLQPGGSS